MAASRGLSKPPRCRFDRTPDRRVLTTDRDDRVIDRIFESRLLSRDHLIGFGFFGSVCRANHTMRRLVDAGLARRVFPVAGSYGVQALYAVGPAAAEKVAERYGIEAAEVRRLACKDPGRLHIEHTVRVNDVCLMLHRAAREAGVGFRWVPEIFARHEFEVHEAARGGWRARILKPDAFFTLTDHDGRVSNFLLECDLGHVGRPQWGRSVRQYCEHAGLGLLPEAYGVEEARVLTVTTGGALRLRHLAEPVPEASSRFLFATFADVEALGVLGGCWSLADGTRVPLLAQGGSDAMV